MTREAEVGASGAARQYDRLPTMASELLRRQVAVIVAMGTPAALSWAPYAGEMQRSTKAGGENNDGVRDRRATQARINALYVVTSRLTLQNLGRIVNFATEKRLPLAGGFGAWAQQRWPFR